jgi:general secretion pathway protein K
MPPAESERGAALLTVLMLVALIAVIAAGALEKLRLATRLTANAVGIEQARSYAQAAEALALSRITTLLGQNRDRVTLAGGWSNAPFGLPLPGGTAVARVSDGGNCFNLNSLVTQVAPGVYASNPIARIQLVRLMRLLGIAPQIAEQVTAGASDWIDTDADQQAGGAEDSAYLGQDPGYRTAGTLMTDRSELRAVAGVTPDLYAQLRPWICSMPTVAAAPINLNTLAPEQAPLVAMLAPDTLTVDAARAALLRRPPFGWANTAAFTALSGVSGTGVGEGQAGVTSKWFALRVDVAVNGLDVQETALIDARRLPARLVNRQWGEE